MESILKWYDLTCSLNFLRFKISRTLSSFLGTEKIGEMNSPGSWEVLTMTFLAKSLEISSSILIS